jgi:LmbE family N-acetylglucosaminyl deacetylase
VLKLRFEPARRPLRMLCLGAHSDDLEIGCGGTLLQWARERGPLEVTWVVLSAPGVRATEARGSARALLGRRTSLEVRLGNFQDGRFPAQFGQLKEYFEVIKSAVRPDVIFTHALDDRHQDHRLCAEMTWQTWRDHLVLEYEIPKYEGDLGEPNLHVPLSAAVARRKVAHLLRHFGSQRSRAWFSEQTFLALMRLRAIECRAPGGFAEAFRVRKLILG